MRFEIMAKVVLWWLAILVFAVINGILREKVLIPALGSFVSLTASGLILSGFIFFVAFFAVSGFNHPSVPIYWLAGFIWLLLTLIFEFGFGLFVLHKDISELLAAYTFKGGNIWPIVLVSTAVSPRLAAHLKGLV
jgi:hypothetical protein